MMDVSFYRTSLSKHAFSLQMGLVLPPGGRDPEFSLFSLNLYESRLPMHSLSPTALYGRFVLLLALFRHWRPGPADEFSRTL